MNVLDAIANACDAVAVRQLGSQLLTPLLDQDCEGSKSGTLHVTFALD